MFEIEIPDVFIVDETGQAPIRRLLNRESEIPTSEDDEDKE